MRSFVYLTILLATTVLAQNPTTSIASPSNSSVWGNAFDYWIQAPTGWDLTRSQLYGSSANSTKVIPVNGKNSPLIIDTQRSALVIIDMQNFFLHPAVQASSVGRDVVPATLNMIDAFRANGMKVLWTNWGLDEFDLRTMPPAFLRGFGNTPETTFGSQMGVINGTDWGRKLMRGSFNAQPWGPLHDQQVQGVNQGTDLYFNKNRLSGLWGAQTPLGLYLQENDITTLFFGGVNADQCVFGTMIDAYFKGYDVIYVEDIAATTSPLFATQMVVFNIGGDGWTANSTSIVPALK
ncbi:Isochorismatase-like protein [Gautieria morchelliformis]|nr:Isochorismatase-like protein [Gautieria morchelliformis]